MPRTSVRKNRRKFSFRPKWTSSSEWKNNIRKSIEAKFRFLGRDPIRKLKRIAFSHHLTVAERAALNLSVLHQQLYNKRLSKEDRLKLAKAIKIESTLLVSGLSGRDSNLRRKNVS